MIKFLKCEDGKYKKAEESEATHVRMNIDEYKNIKNSDDGEYVTIKKSEYSGLQKALRMLKEKGLQQIEKAKADKNGFTLKNCEEKNYKGTSEMAWLITKSTPFSLKIPVDEAYGIIEAELKQDYNFIEIPTMQVDKENPHNYNKRKPSEIEILKAVKQEKQEAWQERDFLLDNSEFGREMKKFIKENPKIIIGIEKLNGNYGSGTYDVTYWATAQI